MARRRFARSVEDMKSDDDHDTVVQTHELTKRYGDSLAADSVSLTVRRGEVYGFLGPNGAGKTTTLRMILGLVRPTSGSAVVLGQRAGTAEVIARVGALVEGPGFYPYLTGRDNLRVMARYRRLPETVADQALERVDLGSRGGDKFKSYSLGMKQRLGVASALMGDPDLVVLDEPTNGLDPAGMVDMRRLIVDLARGGQTVLLSSHLLDEVQEICDRVGVINHGVLLRESTVSELRGGASLMVRGEPVDRALAVAMALAGDDGVRLDGDGERMLVDLTPDRAPELVRELVAGGVEVHEVGSVARTLEEVFFEMTRTEMEATR
jgi:ABC-2 type transport system ATP-binding protein